MRLAVDDDIEGKIDRLGTNGLSQIVIGRHIKGGQLNGCILRVLSTLVDEVALKGGAANVDKGTLALNHDNLRSGLFEGFHLQLYNYKLWYGKAEANNVEYLDSVGAARQTAL
jgi:hypothetical protein